MSSTAKSGKEKTTSSNLRNHYLSYKSELTKVKLCFVCTLRVNRSRDSAPSFPKVNSFASANYQVSLNSEILVEDLLSLLIMEKKSKFRGIM